MSSFFVLQDWPVDADWLKNKLQCILSGSTKEVYETGSQVADLHLMLSTMLPSSDAETCGTRLRSAVLRACLEGFPDLAREMGLEVLDPDSVRERLSREGREDEVRVFGLIKVSGKLPTYPSPKPTFCPKRELSVNTRELGLEVLDPVSVRERLSSEGREDEVRVFGLIKVSGKLPTYLSPKPTFCPK